jgi:hypothetical protein
MNEREELIRNLIKEKGGTMKQYLHLLKSIVNHETGGTNDYAIRQIGGGPGRGGYQFEEGNNRGGITAVRRTIAYYKSLKKELPEWLKNAVTKKSLDASKLTSEQQDILFLGNMKIHPKADFSKVMTGEQSIPDFWAKYHWAGKKEKEASRLTNFKETYTPLSALEEKKQTIGNDSTLLNKKKDNIYSSPIKKPELIKPVVEKQYNSKTMPQFTKKESEPISETGYDNFDNLINYMKSVNTNKKAYGGNIKADYSKNLNSFNTGGTHEFNPLGGIPLGIGSNGKQNTVEQGETSVNLKKGKYIFSNRITLDGKIQ